MMQALCQRDVYKTLDLDWLSETIHMLGPFYVSPNSTRSEAIALHGELRKRFLGKRPKPCDRTHTLRF